MEDTTAEFTPGQLTAPVPLHWIPRVTVAAKTHIGRVRDHNEDKYEFYFTEDPAQLAARGLVFLVCDGMGGHAAGQIASELTAHTFLMTYLSHPSDDALVAADAAVRAANTYVFQNGNSTAGRRGMGTTLSGLLLRQAEALIVQVGDSRVYRYRGGEYQRLTVDHTFVEESVRGGMLSKAEAEVHPHRHILTRAVGAEERVVPETFTFELQKGDIYLLCSDGLSNHVTDERMADVLGKQSPAAAAFTLIGDALNDGGSDNATVVIVRIDDLQPGPDGDSLGDSPGDSPSEELPE